MQGVIYKAGDKWKCGVWDGTRYREIKDDTVVRLCGESAPGGVHVNFNLTAESLKYLLNEGAPEDIWVRRVVVPECLLTTEDARGRRTNTKEIGGV